MLLCLIFRAQRAKPCILFFDEFDSLAPRLAVKNNFKNRFVVTIKFLGEVMIIQV